MPVPHRRRPAGSRYLVTDCGLVGCPTDENRFGLHGGEETPEPLSRQLKGELRAPNSTLWPSLSRPSKEPFVFALNRQTAIFRVPNCDFVRPSSPVCLAQLGLELDYQLFTLYP